MPAVGAMEVSLLCPSCGREAVPEARFCTFCGALLPGGETAPAPAAGPMSPEEELASIAAQLRTLQGAVNIIQLELTRHTQRLAALELALPAPVVPRQAGPGQLPPPRRPAAATPTAEAIGQSTAAPAVPQTPTARLDAPSPTPEAGLGAGGQPPEPSWMDELLSRNWEWLLGSNWLARIGVLALIIGVGFFLKLAFDNNWIGPAGRVALGLMGGVALLGAGEWWQRKYAVWAQTLTGGGIAILYLSIFAAFALYQLIQPLPALGLFFLVTITAAGLALRYNAVALAVLGIIGGFLTPVMLREQLPDQRLLLAYVLVLDLGVLALATLRNWRWFTLLGLLGSLGLFGFWWLELEPSLALAQTGLTGIFVIFIAATTLFHILWRRPAQAMDFTLMTLNAGAYYAISYGLLSADYRQWMGAFTLLLAVVYGLLAYAVLQRSREQARLSLFSLGIALVFLTIAVPVQLQGPWVSIAWVVEGTVLIWLSSTLRMPELRRFSLPVFLAFAYWHLLRDTSAAFYDDLTPFWNTYALASLAAIAATYLAAWLMHRQRAALLPGEEHLFSVFLAAGTLFLAVTVPVQMEGAWIAVAWAVEGAALVGLSFYLRIYQLRLLSLGIFALMLARLLVMDTFSLDRLDLATFTPVLNLRFLAFGSGIAALYLSAWFARHWRERYVTEGDRWLIPIFLAAANGLTLWLLSFEIIAWVDSALAAAPFPQADNVKSLSLSILWAVYAAMAMVLGVARQWRWARLGGLALLALPVAKLFLLDIRELDNIYRVAAFMFLGAMLVAGGFLYQRNREAFRDFLLQ